MNSSLANFIIYSSASDLKTQLPPGMDLDQFDEYGYTPLIQTAIVNDAQKTKVILEAGADINMADLTGRTALHWAVDNDNHELVQLLLQQKANPNAYTIASQPVLVRPLLRGDTRMKDLLIDAGADLNFAKDYINYKLVGHRFELTGFVDVVDPEGRFTELTYEGFILEFSLGAIRQSLLDYCSNYAARRLQENFGYIQQLAEALEVATQLASFQHYLLDVEEKRQEIKRLLRGNTLVLPIGQDGHAITIIKYHNLLALCDRAEGEDLDKPSVKIFFMNRPSRINVDLLAAIMYKRQSLENIEKIIVRELSLQPVMQLDLYKQMTGNCSWANVEACLPTLMVMQAVHRASSDKEIAEVMTSARRLYRHWREWDKGRALQFCIQDFSSAVKARQASKITLLAAVFVQSCRADRPLDRERAQIIFPFLKTPGFTYVLDSYIRIYCGYRKHPIGDNLRLLLQLCDDIDDFM